MIHILKSNNPFKAADKSINCCFILKEENKDILSKVVLGIIVLGRVILERNILGIVVLKNVIVKMDCPIEMFVLRNVLLGIITFLK